MIWLLILGCAIGFFFLMRWVFVWDQPKFNALTEDAIRVVMAGRAQPEEASLSKSMKFNAALATDQFTAWTHCPSCGEFDCHAMRKRSHHGAVTRPGWLMPRPNIQSQNQSTKHDSRQSESASAAKNGGRNDRHHRRNRRLGRRAAQRLQ